MALNQLIVSFAICIFEPESEDKNRSGKSSGNGRVVGPSQDMRLEMATEFEPKHPLAFIRVVQYDIGNFHK